MLSSMRKAQKTLLIVVATVICIAMVWWTGSDNSQTRRALISVEGKNYSTAEIGRIANLFNLALDIGEGRFASEIYGDRPLEARGSDRTLFVLRLITLRNEAKRLGIDPSPEEISERFRAIPIFLEEGEFSESAVQDYIKIYGGRNRIRRDDIEELVADVLRYEQLQQLIGAGMKPTKWQVDQRYREEYEEFTAYEIFVPSEDYEEGIEITDEQITQYYEENKGNFQSLEKRAMKYAALPLPERPAPELPPGGAGGMRPFTPSGSPESLPGIDLFAPGVGDGGALSIPEIQSDLSSEPEPKSEPETKPEPETPAEPEPKPETPAEPEPKPEPETPADDCQADPEPEPAAAEPKPEETKPEEPAASAETAEPAEPAAKEEPEGKPAEEEPPAEEEKIELTEEQWRIQANQVRIAGNEMLRAVIQGKTLEQAVEEYNAARDEKDHIEVTVQEPFGFDAGVIPDAFLGGGQYAQMADRLPMFFSEAFEDVPESLKTEPLLVVELFKARTESDIDKVAATEGMGSVFLYQLTEIVEPAPLPLEEVREEIVEILKKQEVNARVEAAAAELKEKIVAALKEAETVEQAMEKAGVEATYLPPFTGNSATGSDHASQVPALARNLNPGEVSDPELLSDGALLVYLADRSVPERASEQVDRDRIYNELRNVSVARAFSTWFADRLKNSDADYPRVTNAAGEKVPRSIEEFIRR